jgi:hypothetical protein
MTKAYAELKENYALAAIYISQLEEEKGDLLEALKKLYAVGANQRTIREDTITGNAYAKARIAIEKAEGKP